MSGYSAVVTPFISYIFLATQYAWGIDYVGAAHQVLGEAVRLMNSSRAAHYRYSNMLSIIQSSGMGKSRMVHELADVHFSFPFNLRKRGESAGA
jgi:hypothetical protein